jgi:hypothetical protein
MATTTVLSNPYVSLDANDFTDQCTSAVVTSTKEALEDTAFGSTARTYTAGLESNEISLTLLLSYGASEVEAILAGLVGTKFNTVVGADGSATPAADNPVYTLTNGYLESYTGVNGSVGELQTVDVVIRGGSLSIARS